MSAGRTRGPQHGSLAPRALAVACLAIAVPLAAAPLASAQTDDEIAINLTEFYTDNYTYTDPDVYAWPTGTAASQGLNASTLASGDSVLAGNSKSASFLVIRGNRLVHEAYFHGATAASAKNIHSASKSILSALTGIAIDEGYLSLDTRIGDVLTQYSMSAGKQNITVQNLLTMTSGLNWYEDSTEYNLNNNYVQEILNLQLRYTPGTHWNYSTGDAHLLGAVLANATGQSLYQFAKSRLLDPLGIDVERWGRDQQGYFSGGANFYITPREMAAFGQLYLDEGRGIVPDDWIAESTASRVAPDDYGYYWWLDVNLSGYQGYRAWGWGKQFIYVFPSLDMVVAITHDTQGRVSDTSLNNFVRDYVIVAVVGPAVPPLEGDYNGDIVVDMDDFNLWRTTFGSAVSPWGSGADGNRDGLVDAADYGVWRDHLGNHSPGSGSVSAIPEPTAGALAMWIAALLMRHPAAFVGATALEVEK